MLARPAQGVAELFVTVFPDAEITRLTAQVVKHDAVVVDAHFEVRKVKIVHSFVRYAAPNTGWRRRRRSDRAAEEPVSMLYVTLAADEEPLNGV